ncbi:FG-GAP-like repeat-containing protein [Flavivirga jejuensis]|uniref:FG-GAP-like repeat-containing protein n=1 Tax=Flavivirga jejuensis TaxID=870487 RepID=A0ABT8WW11_9FLAO|nr:FG-GAP-like repeat-containing protein [Flavivirga jejuensis]MDO5977067.1 FG-GAP-like repeat-containing protein [Flavivirga jejuensis]
MKKTILVTHLMFCALILQSFAQSTKEKDNIHLTYVNDTRTANDFPELIQSSIPGAPKLENPQLIMGNSVPVCGEGYGWAAPAVYDWNSDGKKDLLIGEYTSGLKMGLNIGNLIRIYQNNGSDTIPEFNDDYTYAWEVNDLKESTGAPLSINTSCCFPFMPRFKDLNGDGFIDLLSGQYCPGYISWFRGSSKKGFLPEVKLKEHYDPKIDGTNNLSLPITEPESWNYWVASSADFGDFDGDGDQDMILGGAALRFCENIGTKSTPEFGKRTLLFDVKGNQLKSNSSVVPYVVDWDRDGILDILMTDAYQKKGSLAVTFFKGLQPDYVADGRDSLQFEVGIPLFTAKNNGKAFPGSWLNICVADWNSDGVNDLLIGTSIIIIDGAFNHRVSWSWESETGVSKKNPAYFSDRKKEKIAQQIKASNEHQKRLGLGDEVYNKTYMGEQRIIKHYYGQEEYKNLAHVGYVYVMLGRK